MSAEALRLSLPETHLEPAPQLRIEPKLPTVEQVFAQHLKECVPAADQISVTAMHSGYAFDIHQRPGFNNLDPYSLIRQIRQIASQDFRLMLIEDSYSISFPDDENDLRHVLIELSFSPAIMPA